VAGQGAWYCHITTSANRKPAAQPGAALHRENIGHLVRGLASKQACARPVPGVWPAGHTEQLKRPPLPAVRVPVVETAPPCINTAAQAGGRHHSPCE
jgi:hypothetical protein